MAITDPTQPQPYVMYIVAKDTLSPGMLALACAHASLACHLKFGEEPEMKVWVTSSFRKKVCIVNDGEWKNILHLAQTQELKHQVMTESRLDNAETCMVFAARRDWPKAFKYLRLA